MNGRTTVTPDAPSIAEPRPTAGGDRPPEIALVEWGTLALRAGRVAPILPHMAWLIRFPGLIAREEIEQEARRLASTPYGLGRRLLPARVFGGRPRWRPTTEAPAVLFSDEPVVGADGLNAWMNGFLGTRLDPEHDAGWMMACTRTDDGDTVVLVIAHHLFGTARGLINALYAADEEDPTLATTGLRFEPANDYTLKAERRGRRERFTLGLLGAGRLMRALPGIATSRRKRGEAADASLPAPIKKPRGHDRSREPLATRRVTAQAYMPAKLWDETAARWGGTGNTLIAAVATNLLRRARMARGGPPERPMQMLVPVDLSNRDDIDGLGLRAKDPSADGTMTTAVVVLPGGAPVYGDLSELRARMKEAFIADANNAPVVRGAGDAMRLLPEALTYRAAAHSATKYDGCISNVGALPPGMLRIGPHEASKLVMIGFPIGNEALTALLRYRDFVSVSTLTDPERMGGDEDIRAWLAEELAAWGIHDVVD